MLFLSSLSTQISKQKRTSAISTSPPAAVAVFLRSFLSRIARLTANLNLQRSQLKNFDAPVLVQLDCCDNNVAGVYTDGSSRAI